MGYEGHLMVVDDRTAQRADVEAAMAIAASRAHADVGGDSSRPAAPAPTT